MKKEPTSDVLEQVLAERDDARSLAQWLFHNQATPEEKITQAAARPWLTLPSNREAG